jgi:hypothetical protein
VAYDVFLEDFDDLKDIKNFWFDNSKQINKLKKARPETYENIIGVFSKHKERVEN